MVEYKLGWFSLVFGVIWLIIALVFAKGFNAIGIIGIGILIFYVCGVLFMFLGIFYLGVKYGVYKIGSRSKVSKDFDDNKIKIK